MDKRISRKKKNIAKWIGRALVAVFLVGFSAGVSAPIAYAHGQCDENIAALRQDVEEFRATLDRERRHPAGRHQRSMQKKRIARMSAKLEIAESHLAAAKYKPCPDPATLEGQVQELQHQLEHHGQ